MATKATPITIETLEQYYASWYTAQKSLNQNFTPTTEENSGLLVKSAITFTLPQDYTDRTYDRFWGEDIPQGGYIEEYFNDPIMPTPFNKEGDTLLTRVDPSRRPAYYSESLPIQDIVLSRPRVDYYQAMRSAETYAKFMADIDKQFSDSRTLYRNYFAKKGLDNIITLAKNAYATTTTFTANTAYAKGAYLRSAASGSSIVYGVVFKDIPASGGPTTWANAVTGGYIVPLTIMETITDITDNTSAVAFLTSVKTLMERCKHPHQGDSLSGNLLGTSANYFGFIASGKLPIIDTNTLAGAFHQEKLAPGVNFEPVADFGDGNDDIIAMVADDRIVRAHNQINLVEAFNNAENATTKYYAHMAGLVRTSPNVLFHLWKKAA